MRKLKGIMINGEWLGDRIEINSVFRAICSISPIILLEFVKLINNLDTINNKVFIESFEFFNTDGIKICFKNTNLEGSAKLFFILIENELKLKSSFIDIKPNDNALDTKKQDAIKNNLEENSNYIPELKEVDSQINASIENNNLEEKLEKPIVSESKPVSVLDEFTDVAAVQLEDKEILNKEIIKAPEEGYLPLEDELSHSVATSYENISKDKVITKKINSLKSPTNLDEQYQEHSLSEIPVTKIIVQQEPSCTNFSEGIISSGEITKDKEFVPNSLLDNFEINEKFEEKFDCIPELNNEVENTNEEQSDFIDEKKYNHLKENDIIDSEICDINSENNNKKVLSSEFDFHNNSQEALIFDDIENILDNTKLEKQDDAFIEPINYLDDEEAEACLMDLYLNESSAVEPYVKTSDELLNTESTPQDVVMQSILVEMISLKDELDNLKNESSQKITAEEFFGSSDSNSNYVKDEDADFKILSSNDKFNAAILDEECFVAGEKIYRWGKTLYLED